MNKISLTIAAMTLSIAHMSANAGYGSAGECADAVIGSCDHYQNYAAYIGCIKNGVAQCIAAFPDKGSESNVAGMNILAPRPSPELTRKIEAAKSAKRRALAQAQTRP